MESQPPPPAERDRKTTLGSVFMMGFEGTVMTPHIRSLIEDYRLGAVLLNVNNFVSAEQAILLIRELQDTAYKAGHEYPLLIAVDQENGIVRSLVDDRWITQLPSSLGIAATRSKRNAYDVGLITGRELACVGINWILGPSMDVIIERSAPGLGSRAFGDDPLEVARLGGAFIQGLRDGGVASMAKHFPLGGTLRFDESSMTVPVVYNSLEQLRKKVIIPFQEAIRENVDAIMAAGVAISSIGPKLMHACFSKKVVTDLLRQQLGYDGVVVSECLEMNSIADRMGVGQAAVMGIHAGCDVLTICQSLAHQREALSALSLALDNGALSWELVKRNSERVFKLRARRTSWAHALNPPGLAQLAVLRPVHRPLALRIYEESITLVRDQQNCIPLSKALSENSTILVLSPILHHRVPPRERHSHLPPKTSDNDDSKDDTDHSRRHRPQPGAADPRESIVFYGEDYFQDFGRQLALYNVGDVVHTSYTSHGVRSEHEKLIEKANAIVILVADANRNQYQMGFAKHVAALSRFAGAGDCESQRSPPIVIIVSLSSAYDISFNSPFQTHICTYDSSDVSLRCLARVLGGDLVPNERLPGLQPIHTSLQGRQGQSRSSENSISTIHQQAWLVERFDSSRDTVPFQDFLHSLVVTDAISSFRRLEYIDDDSSAVPEMCRAYASAALRAGSGDHSNFSVQHFVIRNTSTGAIYGFASALVFPSLQRGCLGALLVDPEKRELSMGKDLHTSVIRFLAQNYHVKTIQLGAPVAAMYPGVPLTRGETFPESIDFYEKVGWSLKDSQSQRLYSLIYQQTPAREANISRRQVATNPRGIVLDVYWGTSSHDNSSAWKSVLEFLDEALSPYNQPFAKIIYQDVFVQGIADSTETDVALIMARQEESGRIVGSALLFNHTKRSTSDGGSEGDFVSRYFPHLCRIATQKHQAHLATAAAHCIMLCPVVASHNGVQADFIKTVAEALSTRAIAETMRFGTRSLIADMIPESMLDALKDTGFNVQQVFTTAERLTTDIIQVCS